MIDLERTCRYIYDHMDDLGELADASIQDVGFIKWSVISVGAGAWWVLIGWRVLAWVLIGCWLAWVLGCVAALGLLAGWVTVRAG